MLRSTKAVLTLLALTVVLFGHAQNASAISCYSGSGYSGPFPTVNCTTGVTTCYTYTYNTGFVSGCGSCDAAMLYGATLSCVACNTNNCNSLTPSSISCYANYNSWVTEYPGRGVAVNCSTGISSCYLYTTGNNIYSGCGNCSTGTYASCVTCNTPLCNTFLPSSISCYNRSAQLYFTSPYTYLAGNNGVVYPCSTGVTSCYSYLNSTNAQSQGYYSSFAGCGVCDATGVRFGCKTCSTSNCNYFTADSSADTATVSAVVAAGTIALVTKLRFNSI